MRAQEGNRRGSRAGIAAGRCAAGRGGEDGPDQVGPGGQRKRGSGERGRALCGREAPGWLTGGPDWSGASRGVGRTTRLGVDRCALSGQARVGGGGRAGLLAASRWATAAFWAEPGKERMGREWEKEAGRAGLFLGLGWVAIWVLGLAGFWVFLILFYF